MADPDMPALEEHTPEGTTSVPATTIMANLGFVTSHRSWLFADTLCMLRDGKYTDIIIKGN